MNIYFGLLLFAALNTNNFMAVDDIKPGMKGYGLTVFQGTRIDTFKVEVVDIIKNATPKGDIILVKVSGKYIDKAGVISGMSGSPVYLPAGKTGIEAQAESPFGNSTFKLIGALAYNYTAFPVEPYAGVTPIGEMINPTGSSNMGSEKSIEGNSMQDFSRIKLPLNFPGYNAEALPEGISNSLLEPSFRIVTAQAGTGHQDDSILPSPGSSLTIPLVLGDVNWSVMGTCTYRDGNKIWGFGHPFQGLGKAELPFSTGYIYSTIASSYESYKMGATTKVVGTITNDDATSISGVIGAMPPLVEVNLVINSRQFHYQVVKERDLLSMLFPSLVISSIAKQFKTTGEVTVESSLNIFSQKDSFDYKDISTGSIFKAMKDVSQIFSYVNDNPFQKIDIDKISMKIDISDSLKFGKIEELLVDKEKVKPGDEVTLQIVLSTYKDSVAKERVSFKIPQWAYSSSSADGHKNKLTILVRSGDQVRNASIEKVKTFDEFKKWLREAPLDNEFVISLTQEGTSKTILGEDFKSLPPSVSSLFSAQGGAGSGGQDVQRESEIMEKRITTKWVVSGEKTVTLEVE